MKKAIKVLEKRIEILNNKWDETDKKFNANFNHNPITQRTRIVA